MKLPIYQLSHHFIAKSANRLRIQKEYTMNIERIQTYLRNLFCQISNQNSKTLQIMQIDKLTNRQIDKLANWQIRKK